MIIYKVYKFDKAVKEWRKVKVFDCVEKAQEYIYKSWREMDDILCFEKEVIDQDGGGEDAGVIC